MGEQEVLADAGAAVHLNGPIEHTAGHLGRRDFDHRNFLLCGAVADRVHHVGRIEHEPAGLIDLDARFGDPFERDALLREAPAECDALDRTPAQHLERALGETDETHAVMNTPRSEPTLRDFEATSFREQ